MGQEKPQQQQKNEQEQKPEEAPAGPTTISEQAFIELLAGSRLTASCRAKVRCPAAVTAISEGGQEALEAVLSNLLQRLEAKEQISG